MKKFITLMFAFAIAFSVNAQKKVNDAVRTDQNPAPAFYESLSKAQIQIGTGTETGTHLPVEPYYGYSYSQVIYYQSEIGDACNITHISFYYTGDGISASNDWTIYMGHTTKTGFVAVDDWVPVGDLTQVFSAIILDPGSDGWVEFDITDFAYNGTDNLVIAVDENQDGYDDTSDDFYGTEFVGTDRSLNFYADATNPDPASPPDGSRQDYIANVILTTDGAYAHDLGVDLVKPTFVNSGDSYTPKVTLHNYGTETENDFNVIVSIDDGTKAEVYRDTVFLTAQSFWSGDDKLVTMDDVWTTPGDGTYVVTAKVVLVGDENVANDELVDNCVVGEGDIAYCWTSGGDITRGPSYFYLQDPGTVYEIAEITTGWFYSGAWANNTWYIGDYIGKELVIVDPADGSTTTVGSFGTMFIDGLAYDNSTSTMYGTSSQDVLYTIDLTTGAATEVGDFNVTGSSFGNLACSLTGDLYSVNRDDASLYSVNKATGVATIIGTGLGITFTTEAQDIEYDLSNDILYIASNESTSITNLRIVDVAAGLASAPIGAFPGGPQVCGFAVPLTDQTDILTYSFPEQSAPADIDYTAHTIDIAVVYGTSLTALIADFTLVGAATAVVGAVTQVSGTTPNDFTAPVTYAVTGEDMSVQNWIITVTVALNHEASFLTYSLPGQTACDIGAGVINVSFPYGTDVSNLIATFTISEGASVDIDGEPQESGVTANDFTSMVQYKITAEDGIEFNYWNVTATNAPNIETDILTFSIPGASVAVIDYVEHTVDLNMPVGTDVTELINEFTLSDEATALVEGFPMESGDTQNYTDSVIFDINAGDIAYDQDWAVVVHLVTGIEDLAAMGISIYPNPSNGVFNINATETVNLEILDITGKVVKTQILNKSTNVVNITESGVYFLRFSNETTSLVHQIVISK